MSRLLIVVILVAGIATLFKDQIIASAKTKAQEVAVNQVLTPPANGPLIYTPAPVPSKPPQKAPTVAPVPLPLRPAPSPVAPPPPQPPAVKAAELYDFYGASCGPCQEMKHTIDALESTGVVVRRHDVDVDVDLSNKMNITRLPTYVAVRDGKETGRIVGKCSMADLEKLLGRMPRNAVSVEGKNGWRLRVLYPCDSEIGMDLIKKFRDVPELKDFADKYGYQAISTEDPVFSYWYDNGYPMSRTTVVLVDDHGKVVWRAEGKNIPASPDRVLAQLQASTERRGIRNLIGRGGWDSDTSEWDNSPGWRRIGRMR
jgi:thioredoxin 1